MRRVHAILPFSVAILAACGGGSDSSGPAPSNNVVSTVVVTGASSSLQVGQTVQFSAEARNSSGELISAGQASWSVSPASVASIDSKGLVTAIASGTANVKATIQSVSGNLSVPVTDVGIPTIVSVFMPGNSFSPFNVSVKVNGTVRFEFPSNPHNVIFNSRPGMPADIQVTSNVTVSRIFSRTGTFPYDCTIHPGMSGQVTVVP
ncbi:MAG: Ig-like domain-containing protein [Gemmatimonadaceae bacterium]|nr:Ig-like domain-containing protein [Gemmatimonadaceae bacterium]